MQTKLRKLLPNNILGVTLLLVLVPMMMGLYRNFVVDPRPIFGTVIIFLFCVIVGLYIYDKKVNTSDQFKHRAIGILFTILAFGVTFRHEIVEIGLVMSVPVLAILVIDQGIERARFQIPILISALFGFAIIMGFFASHTPLDIATDIAVSSFSAGVLVYFLHYLTQLYKETLKQVVTQSTELYTLNKQLEKVSKTDSLTGLLNRRAAINLMENNISENKNAEGICLAFIDIDHFKQINDNFGHAVGDHVLIEFADICRDITRADDLIARWGGEEFVIYLPNTTLADATSLCERIRSQVESHLFNANVDPLNVTVSLGLTQSKQNETTIDRLIQKADEAMYRAKNSGRNKLELALGTGL